MWWNYFCPEFHCNLEGEELYLQSCIWTLTVGSGLLCLSFEGLAGWKLQICLDNWIYKFYFHSILFINFTSNQFHHRELNLMPTWAKMWTWGVGELWLFFSALLRLLWMDWGYSLGHRLCRSASSLDGKTTCAIKGENKLMGCRQCVQSTALCVPGGVSLRHSGCTALAGKIPFSILFLANLFQSPHQERLLLISVVLLPFQLE